MKIGVIGVGAVGGYFGAKLAQNGEDVTFISRGKTLENIRDKGLRVQSYKGDFTIENPQIVHNFDVIKDADIILFCVKSYSTREIAIALKPRISDKTLIVSMQNGVENEKILSEIFGEERVIGSVVFITSAMPEPGLIKHTSYGKIILGELNGKDTERIRNIESLFRNAGVPVGVTTEIYRELWKKLMLNIPYNGFTAVIGNSLRGYHSIPQAKECFLQSLKEVQLVAQAEGHILTDEDIENALKFTKHENFMNFKSSTLLDAQAGKALEIDAMHGAVVRAAEKHKLDIPVNKLLYSLLKLKFS